MTPYPIAKPKLLVRNGLFRLIAVDADARKKIEADPHWKKSSDFGIYETTSLKAAGRWRHVADEYAEKTFNRAFQTHYDLPPLPPLPLDDHQWEGVRWILSRKRSYLAHAPGAGKTIQAIVAACLTPDGRRSLFIVPPQLTKNWEREIWKVTEWLGVFPTISVVPRSEGRHDMALGADFIICPDSMLTRDWVQGFLRVVPKKFIAVDEASRFKDPTAERSLAFYGGRGKERDYAGLFQDARHVVFMDGSPMPNRPIELWAPTYALCPEAIDGLGYDDFGYRYCGAKPNAYGQWEYLYSSHEAELNQKLRKDFMHVVKEEELTHPERLRSLLYMDDDPRTPEMRAWDDKHPSFNSERYTPRPDERHSKGELANQRRLLGERKVPWIADYVRYRLKDKNESILLFVWHRSVATALMEALKDFKPGLIIGGVSEESREAALREFQYGKKRLLILNIAAAGRGFNLQVASRVIFGEFSWTDELNKQCEKRASRRGSIKFFVRCEYIVAPGSMDEVVMRSLFTKEKRVRKVIG